MTLFRRAAIVGAGRPPYWIDGVYLIDTNVVSELRRRQPHGAVLAWLNGVPDEHLHLSVVTLGELQAGVEVTREQDPGKAAEIESWIEQVGQTFNMIDLDGRTLRLWATLLHGRSDDLIEDALIAATAIVHQLIVVTRNTKDFRAWDVPLFDPFSSA